MTAKQRVVGLGIAVLKRNEPLRRRYRALATRARNLRYRWYARGRADPLLVVFECFVGRSYAGSPRAVYEAMLADPRFAQHRFVWVLARPERLPADDRTTVVGYRTPAMYRAYGRAGTWVGNSILAPEIVPGPGQTYVQTWHGTPFKRIGVDVVATTETAMNGKAEIDDRYRTEAAKVTRFLSAGAFTTACFTTAFDVPTDRARTLFAETGNPRNDVLATATPADVAAARERLGIPDGKRVVLYAPTWRDDQHDARSGYVFRQPLDLTALRASLGEDVIVVFRAHYLVTNALDLDAHRGFVRDVSSVDEINELCLAADVLVTDYSSVFFDYALLDRPMVFFAYDLERYEGALRGFYLPVADLPGPLVRTQDELVEALRTTSTDEAYRSSRAEVVRTYAPHDDGGATGRVLDLLAAPGPMAPDH